MHTQSARHCSDLTSTNILGGALACRACAGRTPGIFFYHSSLVPDFAPTSPNNLEYLLAVSRNLAHPLHPAYDDGKGGGWKWWDTHTHTQRPQYAKKF